MNGHLTYIIDVLLQAQRQIQRCPDSGLDHPSDMCMREAAVDRLQCLLKVSRYITSNHILPVMHQEMGIVCFFESAEEVEPETAHFTNLHPAIDINDRKGGSYISHGEDITRFVHHVEEGVVFETTVDVGIKR